MPYKSLVSLTRIMLFGNTMFQQLYFHTVVSSVSVLMMLKPLEPHLIIMVLFDECLIHLCDHCQRLNLKNQLQIQEGARVATPN